MVKFAHIADAHIGGWSDPKLSLLSVEAFNKAVDESISEGVDFVIIAGDLFNTALPGIEYMNVVTRRLSDLKNNGIPVYAVPGSHDFSPSGKTFLSTLEEAGLLVLLNKASLKDGRLVLKPFVDENNKVVLFGMPGRRASLEKSYYEILSSPNLESFKDYFKIFVFHSAVLELTSNPAYSSTAIPISHLPEGFDYYAVGHVHSVIEREFSNRLVVFPGPVFPNSFSELEDLKHGGFYIVSVDSSGEISLKYKSIIVKNVYSLSFNATSLTPQDVFAGIKSKLSDKEFYDTIVLIRVFGTLKSGKIFDIDFNSILKFVYEKGAYSVLKNTYSLSTKELNLVKVNSSGVEDLEKKTIKNNISKLSFVEDSEKFFNELVKILSDSQVDGEPKSRFESRLCSSFDYLLSSMNIDK